MGYMDTTFMATKELTDTKGIKIPKGTLLKPSGYKGTGLIFRSMATGRAFTIQPPAINHLKAQPDKELLLIASFIPKLPEHTFGGDYNTAFIFEH